MKSKTTAWLAVLALALVAPASAQTATTVTEGHVVYTLEDDHYVATSVAQASGLTIDTLVIADAIEGLPVTAVGPSAFDGSKYSICCHIVHVVVGDNVTAIDHEAFYLCRSLASVQLGRGLRTIGKWAFYSCDALTDVAFPDGLECIGAQAFLGCLSLTSLTLPASVQEVGEGAFYHCSRLARLEVLGDGVQLGVSAFSQCGLQTVRFAGAVPVLGDGAFHSTGTKEQPVSVFVPEDRLADYVALTSGDGSAYGWTVGNGLTTLRFGHEGLVYNYVAATTDGATPHLLVSAIDTASVVNLGSTAAPVFLPRAAAALQGHAVTALAPTASFAADTLARHLSAIDLRSLQQTGITLRRTQGFFAGVDAATLVYLPEGNGSDEANVVVGGRLTGALTVGADTEAIAEADVASGRAAWLLNDYWGTPVFGQQMGVDSAPVPLTTPAEQRVWQATFMGRDSLFQYRYANPGQTLNLPSATMMGYAEATPISFYVDDSIDQPFTVASTLSADALVYARPQVSDLTLVADTLTLLMSSPTAERKFQLSATVQPDDAHAEVAWTTADPQVATVDADGMVWGVKEGHTIVTATSRDNPAVSRQCRLTVVPQPTGIAFEEDHVQVESSMLAPATCQLHCHVYPAEAIQDVLYESADTTIATVDAQGVVTGVKFGVTYVFATPRDNMSITTFCKVTVMPAATGLWVSKAHATLLPGEQVSLTARVLPDTAPQDVTWTSADTTIATVTPQGVVVARAAGVTTITATADCAPIYSRSCHVSVLGVGVPVPVGGITYLVTAMDDDHHTMAVIDVPDSIVCNANMQKLPSTITHGNLRFAVTEVADTAIHHPRENAYVFIPSGITYRGDADNVVCLREGDHAHTCRRLVITEGFDFRMAYPFTAETLVYERTCPWGPFTISLPFSARASEEGMYFFDMKRVEGDSIVFESVEETVPYKPYLAVSAHRKVDLGGHNVEFPALSRVMTVIIRDLQFVPVAARTIPSEAGITNGHLPNGILWQRFADDHLLQPLTAWLYSPRSTPVFTKLVGKGSETGVQSPTWTGADAPIYDLRGRCLGTDVRQLSKGVYVRDGKKFVKQ